MSESKLQKKALRLCRKAGFLCYKVHAEAAVGFPDLMVFRPDGECFLIEVKNPDGGGRLSKMQTARINELLEQKVRVYVVDTVDFLDRVLTHEADAIRC